MTLYHVDIKACCIAAACRHWSSVQYTFSIIDFSLRFFVSFLLATMADSPGLPPDVDVVIVFRATNKYSFSKQQTREEAKKAEQQYLRLIDTLTYAGLKAVGRRGESLGQLLVLVACPQNHLESLVRRERCADLDHVTVEQN